MYINIIFKKFNDTTLRLPMYKRFIKTLSFTKPLHAFVVHVYVCVCLCVLVLFVAMHKYV